LYLDISASQEFEVVEIDKFDSILWTAAITDINYCEKYPMKTWEMNVENTWQLIKKSDHWKIL
jgi:dTDP-4-dehydrorhamnose reductase